MADPRNLREAFERDRAGQAQHNAKHQSTNAAAKAQQDALHSHAQNGAGQRGSFQHPQQSGGKRGR